MTNDDPQRLPPQSIESEKGVLGAMIRDNRSIDDVVGIVAADGFYRDAHQKIFRAILDVRNDGKPVDTVILFETLKQRKQLEDVGGAEYLADLWDSAPTAANAEYYARIVRDKAVVRNLIHLATELLRDAYDGVYQADDLLAQFERRLTELVAPVRASQQSMSEALADALSRIDERARAGGQAGLPTGIRQLDNMTNGLHPRELTTIAARTGLGKSALAAVMAESAARASAPRVVLFVSLEMANAEVAERMLIRRSGVDSWRVRRGELRDEDARALIAANDRLRGLPLVFEDGVDATVSKIRSMARRLARRPGLAAVFVDYLQLMEVEDRRAKRHEQVGAISRGLKLLAKELRVPVVALAQLNREGEAQNRSPRLSDIRESGSVEQDSDSVLFLHSDRKPDDAPADPEPVELIVAKQRAGPKGSIPLLFRGSRFRFEEQVPE